ncbi:membrane-associated Zn-dependent protease [Methanobrevibacter sp. 87.7]|uniref:site-2 protease family protein n=1 Tax=Methanobrevibacter sp. 87.7 TaxID=387957 RepID=UPI000B4FFD9A|nr:site-2 protease family protein [Methanobrevibacter sp. 87.7]OWT33116.1 membrane-associated Zn-dependent protease [Methanobrevibacter sp. 87.7]
MNGIWYYVIGFIFVWTILALYKMYHEDSNLELGFPIIMWRTHKFIDFVDKLAKKAPKFWKWYMNIGIVICFGAMGLMTYLLIVSLGTITTTPSVSILIPGVDIPGSPIFIPFLSGFIALIILLIVHEFSHGILARVENVDVKSMGLLLFFIIPGAFVEPDEEQVSKVSKLSRLRILGAGSMANIVLAVVALLLVALLANCAIPAVYDQQGVEVTQVVTNAPAVGHISKGELLTGINNKTIKNSTDYVHAVYNLTPNTTVELKTNKGTSSFKLGENPNNKTIGYMGIRCQEHFVIKEDIKNTYGDILPWFWLSLEDLLKWIYIINLSVGLFNLLPMKPLDGGKMLEEVLSYKLSEDTSYLITLFTSVLIGIIIIASLLIGILIGFNII